MAAKKSATKKTTGGAATKKAASTKSSSSAAKTKPAAPRAAAKKPVKLSDAQEKILRQIDHTGETGYFPANKTELRSIDKLRELKLVKRGTKDKVKNEYPYVISATGKKHLAQAPA